MHTTAWILVMSLVEFYSVYLGNTKYIFNCSLEQMKYVFNVKKNPKTTTPKQNRAHHKHTHEKPLMRLNHPFKWWLYKLVLSLFVWVNAQKNPKPTGSQRSTGIQPYARTHTHTISQILKKLAIIQPLPLTDQYTHVHTHTQFVGAFPSVVIDSAYSVLVSCNSKNRRGALRARHIYRFHKTFESIRFFSKVKFAQEDWLTRSDMNVAICKNCGVTLQSH